MRPAGVAFLFLPGLLRTGGGDATMAGVAGCPALGRPLERRPRPPTSLRRRSRGYIVSPARRRRVAADTAPRHSWRERPQWMAPPRFPASTHAKRKDDGGQGIIGCRLQDDDDRRIHGGELELRQLGARLQA
jgi:hypothetical protein